MLRWGARGSLLAALVGCGRTDLDAPLETRRDGGTVIDAAGSEWFTCSPDAGAADCDAGTPFDRVATACAVEAVPVARCRALGVAGSGHVKITFAPDGSVTNVDVDEPPFRGSSAEPCLVKLFERVRVPAWCGAPVTVGKSFAL